MIPLYFSHRHTVGPRQRPITTAATDTTIPTAIAVVTLASASPTSDGELPFVGVGDKGRVIEGIAVASVGDGSSGADRVEFIVVKIVVTSFGGKPGGAMLVVGKTWSIGAGSTCSGRTDDAGSYATEGTRLESCFC